MKDKEAVVRVQAALGMARLMEMGVGEGGSDEDDDEGVMRGGALITLIDSMQNDPSA